MTQKIKSMADLMKEFWNYVFFARYTKEEAGVGVESGLRGRLEWSSRWSPAVPCTITATTKNSVEGERWWRTFLMGVHFCFQVGRGRFFQVGWQVLTFSKISPFWWMWCSQASLTTCIFYILYRICTEYTVYWKFTCTLYSYLCCSYMSFCESWTSLCFFSSFAFIEHFMSTRLDQPSPCCPTWTLWLHRWKLDQIHQGSVSHFQHGHQGDFQHLGRSKGRSFSGELWIGSPFNMTDEGKFYNIYIYVYIYIHYICEWRVGGKFVRLEGFCGEMSADQ